MRAVVQRVSSCTIRVGGEAVSEMGEGLLALIGVESGDIEEDAVALASRLVHLRVFPDSQGRMNCSLLESGGTLGVVSQFTLLGDCRKGRRPSYASAAAPEQAEPLIERVAAESARLGAPTISGRFRAQMSVCLCNEGPVTLLLDTRKIF